LVIAEKNDKKWPSLKKKMADKMALPPELHAHVARFLQYRWFLNLVCVLPREVREHKAMHRVHRIVAKAFVRCYAHPIVAIYKRYPMRVSYTAFASCLKHSRVQATTLTLLSSDRGFNASITVEDGFAELNVRRRVMQHNRRSLGKFSGDASNYNARTICRATQRACPVLFIHAVNGISLSAFKVEELRFMLLAQKWCVFRVGSRLVKLQPTPNFESCYFQI
jgi:hypothetical protein